MMPTPLIVLALRAAHCARSEDDAPKHTQQDRRTSIRLVSDAGAKPANTPHSFHPKER